MLTAKEAREYKQKTLEEQTQKTLERLDKIVKSKAASGETSIKVDSLGVLEGMLLRDKLTSLGYNTTLETLKGGKCNLSLWWGEKKKSTVAATDNWSVAEAAEERDSLQDIGEVPEDDRFDALDEF